MIIRTFNDGYINLKYYKRFFTQSVMKGDKLSLDLVCITPCGEVERFELLESFDMKKASKIYSHLSEFINSINVDIYHESHISDIVQFPVYFEED